MKLRIQGNSVRVRMDRRDVDQLASEGRVVDSLRLGPGPGLTYRVEVGEAARNLPHAKLVGTTLSITLHHDDAASWPNDNRVGFERDQETDGVVVRVVLEKDFACLDRSDAENVDAFPHPSRDCGRETTTRPDFN